MKTAMVIFTAFLGGCSPSLEIGKLCMRQNDCKSGLCVSIAGTLRCSDFCATDDQCPPGGTWYCAGLSDVANDAGTGIQPGICQCIPSSDRTCDGRDKDCNGIIDDECIPPVFQPPDGGETDGSPPPIDFSAAVDG